MLKSFDRVFTRILALAVLALVALGAFGYFVIQESRNNLYEQKRNEIKHIVESAVAMVVDLAKRADKGEITKEQAQAEARAGQVESHDAVMAGLFKRFNLAD